MLKKLRRRNDHGMAGLRRMYAGPTILVVDFFQSRFLAHFRRFGQDFSAW